MNKEFLRAMSRMVELGKMTKEEALRTFLDEMVEEFAPLIDSLHTVACIKQHACDPTHLNRRRKDVCYYELEGQIQECWELPDHREWVEVFYKMVLESGYDGIQDVINAIGAISANTQLLAAKSPEALRIALGIFSTLSETPP